MRIKLPHAPYIARKIALDLFNSGLVNFASGIDPVAKVATEILEDDIKKERALEERVSELLEENETEMEFMQVDRKNMFWLVKKKLADDFGVILSYGDRYNNLSHIILEQIWKRNLIDYSVSENRMRNIIFGSIESYLKTYEEIEDIVIEKLENQTKKLIPGTEEYDLTYERFYKEELIKKGMF